MSATKIYVNMRSRCNRNFTLFVVSFRFLCSLESYNKQSC